MSARNRKNDHVTVTVSRDVTLPAVTKRLPVTGHSIAVPPGLVLYADGCCEPNPGIGGWGFVVYRDGVEVHAESGGDGEATNQRMELVAAIRAVQWLTANVGSGFANVRLLSDSAYVVNGSNDWRHKWKARGWRRKSAESAEKNQQIANLDLWKALDAALTVVPIELEWVKGHCGIIGNERADELSLIGRETVFDRSPTTLDQIRHQLDYSSRI
ncbi:MAG: ribonuclease HI [Mesorhizobium sp.]|nr:MAG: ribonuclease HI [Mesorhizobium sp.]